MKINKEKVNHYFECLKSRTNDPFDWIDKGILSEKEFSFLDNAFDEVWLIHQKLCSKSYEKDILQKIIVSFEDTETYEVFISLVVKANKKKIFLAKSDYFFLVSCSI